MFLEIADHHDVRLDDVDVLGRTLESNIVGSDKGMTGSTLEPSIENGKEFGRLLGG